VKIIISYVYEITEFIRAVTVRKIKYLQLEFCDNVEDLSAVT